MRERSRKELKRCIDYLACPNPFDPDHGRGIEGAVAGANDWFFESLLEDMEDELVPSLGYEEFLQRKTQSGSMDGFLPTFRPKFLFDFQEALVDWAVRKGKAAIFADCGLGKTPMQLVWAENVVRKTNRPVLILTPLAVSSQTKQEGEKFGIECERSSGGDISKPGIYITNYEKLSHFNSTDFSGVVCDESSILKHFSGATQQAVTRFTLKTSYRLLCTATAAPNDYYELGTSSEVLGYLGYSDMLSRFFAQDDKKRCRMNDVKLARDARKGHYQKLAYRVSQQIGAYRLKGHSEIPFWRWVSSWARACRKPSDLGFDDSLFHLPELVKEDHVIQPKTPAEGMLFTLPAFGLKEERDERRRTLQDRCDYVAALVSHPNPAVIWCHLNSEGDLLERMIPDSVQVKGSQSDEEKIERYEAFTSRQVSKIIIKPKIGAWGLNWQHCAHVVTFVTHSYEQYYQAIRRCWRFGQKNPVKVDVIATEAEVHVRENMVRKSEAADHMFSELVKYMRQAQNISRERIETKTEVPAWLKSS